MERRQESFGGSWGFVVGMGRCDCEKELLTVQVWTASMALYEFER